MMLVYTSKDLVVQGYTESNFQADRDMLNLCVGQCSLSMEERLFGEV